jgi:hypothetical protein
MQLLRSIALAYVRHGLTLASGYLLAHGLIDQAGSEILLSAGLAVAGVVWSTGQKFAAQLELQLALKEQALPATQGGKS